ncbi:hypothetical protein K438DRAFT_1980897 [Mycena galopus ATCC 62051]|nr:hypothetical protein K438DRAFT_1980897 [Mycena galopus ATCC 62051]
MSVHFAHSTAQRLHRALSSPTRRHQALVFVSALADALPLPSLLRLPRYEYERGSGGKRTVLVALCYPHTADNLSLLGPPHTSTARHAAASAPFALLAAPRLASQQRRPHSLTSPRARMATTLPLSWLVPTAARTSSCRSQPSATRRASAVCIEAAHASACAVSPFL